MPRMTQEERDKLLIRKNQLEARIKDFDTHAEKQKRKSETRAKILYGALAMEHAVSNPDSEFAATMNHLLNRYVIRAQDRKLLGLEPREPEPQQTATVMTIAEAANDQRADDAMIEDDETAF